MRKNKKKDVEKVEEQFPAEEALENEEKASEQVEKESTGTDTDLEQNTQPEDKTTVDTFLSSLDSYKTEESADEGKKKRKKRSKGFWGWLILLSVCVTVFVVSAVMIGLNVYEGYSSDKMHSEMNEEFFGNTDRDDLMEKLSPVVLSNNLPKYGSVRSNMAGGEYQVITTNNPLHAQFKEKLLEYRKINPEIYGWIQVDGTDISYAIVRGQDNNFYLNHNALGEYNTNGAIFADFRVEDDVLDNPNLVIYGHNSSYLQQMFNQVDKFLDQSFFEQNRYITVYTIDGVYRYEIFSIYETYSTYSYCQMNFISDNSFVNWCNEMKTNSLYYRETTPFTPNSRLITLSTCTNGYFTRRYSLQGKLVTVEKAS